MYLVYSTTEREKQMDLIFNIIAALNAVSSVSIRHCVYVRCKNRTSRTTDSFVSDLLKVVTRAIRYNTKEKLHLQYIGG